MSRLPGDRSLNALAALACAAMMAYALYAQYRLLMEPCPLCVFQRMATIALGVVFLAAALQGPKGWGRRGSTRRFTRWTSACASTTSGRSRPCTVACWKSCCCNGSYWCAGCNLQAGCSRAVRRSERRCGRGRAFQGRARQGCRARSVHGCIYSVPEKPSLGRVFANHCSQASRTTCL